MNTLTIVGPLHNDTKRYLCFSQPLLIFLVQLAQINCFLSSQTSSDHHLRTRDYITMWHTPYLLSDKSWAGHTHLRHWPARSAASTALTFEPRVRNHITPAANSHALRQVFPATTSRWISLSHFLVWPCGNITSNFPRLFPPCTHCIISSLHSLPFHPQVCLSPFLPSLHPSSLPSPTVCPTIHRFPSLSPSLPPSFHLHSPRVLSLSSSLHPASPPSSLFSHRRPHSVDAKTLSVYKHDAPWPWDGIPHPRQINEWKYTVHQNCECVCVYVCMYACVCMNAKSELDECIRAMSHSIVRKLDLKS